MAERREFVPVGVCEWCGRPIGWRSGRWDDPGYGMRGGTIGRHGRTWRLCLPCCAVFDTEEALVAGGPR